jgi:hypothetical protein
MQLAFARHLLDCAFRALGRVRPTGFGFHKLPRKFATDLEDEPIKVVAKLGGWRDLETLLRYQRVTDDDPRAPLRARRTRRCGPPAGAKKSGAPSWWRGPRSISCLNHNCDLNGDLEVSLWARRDSNARPLAPEASSRRLARSGQTRGALMYNDLAR